ncbi:recombinase family protein [Kocuria sp. LHG3120]|uniref:recombinase family protein n=1 Tax=Kocuria sp. LHG3120 TaxID=2804590 RepID=UPI003CF14813
MKFGYARVSTMNQAEGGVSLDEQVARLTADGVEDANIYIERGVSGKLTSRPEMDKLLHKVRKGDEVVVTRLDRFGRNNAHLHQLIEQFTKDGITFRSLHEGATNEGSFGRFMLSMLSSLAQLERERISERTREGLANAAEQGRMGGRRQVSADDTRVRRARELADRGLTRAEIGKAMGVSAQTVWRWLKLTTSDAEK